MSRSWAIRYYRRVLRDLGLALRRQPIPTGKRTIHFLHVGKNAGTYIRGLLRELNAEQRSVYFRSHAHRVWLRDLPTNAEYFFAIRSPIDRFLSGFYNKVDRVGSPHSTELSDDEIIAIKHFPTANDLAENLFSTGKLGFLANRAMLSHGHIAREQRLFFTDFGFFAQTRPPIRIISTSHLHEDLGEFFGFLGIQESLATRVLGGASEANRNARRITHLSPKAVANLKQWFFPEIRFYEDCLMLRKSLLEARTGKK